MINYILSLFLLYIFFSLFVIIEQIHSISAESPTVDIFPECGALTDHKIYFTLNGFNLTEMYIGNLLILKEI